VWTVDLDSLGAAQGTWPVHAEVRCPEAPPGAPVLDGEPIVALGVAAVFYSRKQGTMAWGHASLRTLYCRGGAVVDREFETYRLSAWNEEQLRYEHAGEPFLDDPWLRTQRGALVLFRNDDPVDRAFYAEAQAHNREIYELWLDLPQDELDAIVLAAEGWRARQLADLRAHVPQTERYVPWTTNCTSVLRLLPDELEPSSALPFAWLRALEDDARARVLHPSVHLLRTWDGDPPAETERRHPIFRSGSGSYDLRRHEYEDLR
jgi:hypothetical protein